jgi:hypothetical protein
MKVLVWSICLCNIRITIPGEMRTRRTTYSSVTICGNECVLAHPALNYLRSISLPVQGLIKVLLFCRSLCNAHNIKQWDMRKQTSYPQCYKHWNITFIWPAASKRRHEYYCVQKNKIWGYFKLQSRFSVIHVRIQFETWAYHSKKPSLPDALKCSYFSLTKEGVAKIN